MTRTQEAPADRTMTGELSALWAHRDEEHARAALVARFMPLARSFARRYERSSEPLDDLVQVASMGLVKAIDRFDPARGNAFVSYAVPTILGELRRYFRDCCWDVHVPRGAQELALRVEETQSELTVSLGRPPTVRELAEYLELDVEHVLDAMAARNAYVVSSLDAPRSNPDGTDAGTYGDSHRRDRRALRARRGERRDRRSARAPLRARADRAAPALRAGHDAVGDRCRDRRLADARVEAAAPGDRAVADPRARPRVHPATRTGRSRARRCPARSRYRCPSARNDRARAARGHGDRNRMTGAP